MSRMALAVCVCLGLAVTSTQGDETPAASKEKSPPPPKKIGDDKNSFDKNQQPVGKPAAKLSRPPRDWGPLTAAIDREWAKALEAAQIPASPEADDAEFLRRISLDLTGRIPTYERTVAFLSSEDPNKRRDLVDELLATREFGLHFGQKWRHLILPRDTGSSKQQQDRFTPWLADKLGADRPWSEIVTELLTTEADLYRDPSATFFLANSEESNPKPSLLAASAGRLFLGVQVGCAECHDHPFAEWTQDDFWGLAAFFSRVRKVSKGDSRLTEDPVDGAPARSSTPKITLPEGAGKRSGEAVAARFLLGSTPAISSGAAARPALAAWLTSRENPYFAKAAVNRLWAQIMGRGLVNPVDDFHSENAASHPELLAALSREFAESGHDIKYVLRAICNSRAYQRTSRPLAENETDQKLFSHAAVKVMTPEMLYDSLHVVLNAKTKTVVGRGGKPVKGFVQSIEPRDSFVRYFARSAEADLGEQFAYGVPQLLRLLNAREYNVSPPFIAEQVGDEVPPEKLIETLYLVALSRRPSKHETQRMLRLIKDESDQTGACAGALWVLLNSSEFVLNH